jgi:hypothetical protein
MSTKHDKKGPELFNISESMLSGVETLAKQFKHAHDNHNYDFLMSIKTGLSKIVAAIPDMNILSVNLKLQAKNMTALAEWIEQLFPEVKSQDKNEEIAK